MSWATKVAKQLPKILSFSPWVLYAEELQVTLPGETKSKTKSTFRELPSRFAARLNKLIAEEDKILLNRIAGSECEDWDTVLRFCGLEAVGTFQDDSKLDLENTLDLWHALCDGIIGEVVAPFYRAWVRVFDPWPTKLSNQAVKKHRKELRILREELEAEAEHKRAQENEGQTPTTYPKIEDAEKNEDSTIEKEKPTYGDLSFLSCLRCQAGEKGDTPVDDEKEVSAHPDGMSLMYGECKFLALAYCMIKGWDFAGREDVFLDLGSGTGKSLVLAVLLHEFRTVVGVEFLSCLHVSACSVLDELVQWSSSREEGTKEDTKSAGEKNTGRFDEDAVLAKVNVRRLCSHQAGKFAVGGISQYKWTEDNHTTVFMLVQDDIFRYNWDAATHIFANSTCFSRRLMARLQQKSAKCSAEKQWITYTKPLRLRHYALRFSRMYRQSWGECTVHCAARRAADVVPSRKSSSFEAGKEQPGASHGVLDRQTPAPSLKDQVRKQEELIRLYAPADD